MYIHEECGKAFYAIMSSENGPLEKKTLPIYPTVNNLTSHFPL